MRMKRNYLKGIELGRTIGVEVEGYSGEYSRMVNDNRVRHSQLKYDGSLYNFSHYRGIEVVTQPLTKLDMLDEVFEDIVKYDWNVGRGCAGTHIHVDARDYKLEDRLKMAIFMNLIEKAMFLLVKKQRWSRRRGHRNSYCRPIDSAWKQFLNRLNTEFANVDWRQHKSVGDFQLSMMRRMSREGRHFNVRIPNTIRYQFVNIWSSSHDTIEFRIFHAIRSARDAKLFTLIAYNLVEMVKHSTIEHLEFLADGIMNQSTSAENMIERFAQSIGLEFTPKIYNTQLADSINRDKRVAMRIYGRASAI